MAFGEKRNRVKDRPWAKKRVENDLLDEEQVDIIGVRHNTSDNEADGTNGGNDGGTNGEDDANLSYDEELNERLLQAQITSRSLRVTTAPAQDDNPPTPNAYLSSIDIDDDVPSRWRSNVSSPQERDEANVLALGLAAERAAYKSLRREEWQERLQERTDEVTRRRSTDPRAEEGRGRAGSHRYSSVVDNDKEGTTCDETNSDTGYYTKSSGTIQSAFSKAKRTVVTNLNRTHNNNTTTSTISRVPTPSKDDLTRHEQVRMDALMMLRLADHKPANNSSNSSDTTTNGLHKTETGGYSTQTRQVNALPPVGRPTREHAALRGLGLDGRGGAGYTPQGRVATSTAMYGPTGGRFRISDEEEVNDGFDDDGDDVRKRLYDNKDDEGDGLSPRANDARRNGKSEGRMFGLMSPTTKYSHLDDVLLIEEDGQNEASDMGGNDEKKKRPKGWGSRYSVDRHMRALHGGLSSKQVLNRMDRENYEDSSNVSSAKGLYRASPHDNEDGYGTSRWKVGSHVHAPNIYSDGKGPKRMWNTMVASVLNTWEGITTRKDDEGESESYTTKGEHRNINNSGTSPNDRSKNKSRVFTGISEVISKLSPRSGNTSPTSSKKDGDDSSCGSSISNSFRNFNLCTLNDLPPNMNFSAQDDYQIERQRKRRRLFLIASATILLLAVLLGVLTGVSHTNRATHHRPTNGSTRPAVSFYAISNTPNDATEETQLRRNLSALDPSQGSFLFHLGGAMMGGSTECTDDSFRDAADVMGESPVPVLILPGNGDWKDCPVPMDAFANWMKELNRFEERYDGFGPDVHEGEGERVLPVVERHLARDENFAILLEDVLIIGVHLVDGDVAPSQREWSLRHQDNVQWVEEQLSRHRFQLGSNSDVEHPYRDDDGMEYPSPLSVSEPVYRAVVMLGYAPPTPQIADFFGPVEHDLARENIPVLYLHADDGGGNPDLVQYVPFPEDVPRMVAAKMPAGGVEGILKVRVGHGPQTFEFELTV